MTDLQDGESTEMKGSGARPYTLKNTGGVYSCSCPAWRNQSTPIERRTCKHLRKLRGDAAEEARLGGALAAPVRTPKEGVVKPPLMLAEVWDGVLDPTGYWLSEKLDGVRALWRAESRQFISRLGNVYLAPDWFTAGLPLQDLDGELWLGRKQFQRCISIVRRQDKSDAWRDVRFLVFDAPQASGPFEQRAQLAQSLLVGPEFAAWHDHVVCGGTKHVRDELARVEALGAEGLMLRAPGSAYVEGRSTALLKVKSFTDEEAAVLGHEPGKGRHKGRLGALRVKLLSSGIEFSVGTGFSDADRADPPPVGSVVTVKYQELTEAGVPRFSTYLGVRQD